MQSERVKSEFVIHWGDIFRYILKRWWLVLFCLIIGCAGGAAYGWLSYQPLYETQAVYIVSYTGAGETMGDLSSEYSLVQRVLQNCIIIGQQNKFMIALQEAVNQGVSTTSSDYLSANYLQTVVTYGNDAENSNANGTTLTVSIKTDNARKSLRITNSLTSIFANYVTENYKLAEEESLVFSLINTPMAATSPIEGSKTVLFGVLMGLAFAVLAAAILFFVALFDDRIKTETDIEDKYNIPVLGVIPRLEDIISIKGEKKHGRK